MLLKKTFNNFFKNRSDRKTISLHNNLSLLHNTSLNLINNNIVSKNIVYDYISRLKKISNMSVLNKDISSIIKMYNNIFNSSSCSIIKHSFDNEQYIINTRFVNYKLDNIGKSDISYKKGITINKIDILDKNFNIINSRYLFPKNLNKKINGIEDVRLFNINNKIYYVGSYYNEKNNKIQIVSNEFNIDADFNIKIIIPRFKTSFDWEKNWVFFDNNGEPSIIYKWYPIYICKIDYEKNNLNLVKSIENLPEIFDKFRGSTNGVLYDNKIWFIVHQQNTISNNLKSYEHNIVVFDKDMKLMGYSDTFKFENYLVEFCIGMEITYDNKFVITYSTLDSTSKLTIFTPEYINSLINYIII